MAFAGHKDDVDERLLRVYGRARGWVGLAFGWRRARRKLENSIKREERPKGEGVHTSQRGEAPAGGGRMRCMGQEGGGIGYFGDLAEAGWV